jgi:predicted mannosyl-3-phosphoglycerate phosphatase (HAD superfamily)
MSIDTYGYGTSEGTTAQITLPSGKYMYTGVGSVIHNLARELGLETKVVRYSGACIYMNINSRAHEKFPIEIDGVSVADFLDKIATEEECRTWHDAQ